MRIVNPDVLRLFRGPGECDFCERPCLVREAAHVFGKGWGGSDVEWNLVALGDAWSCACHRKSHDGHRPTRADLLEVVSVRLGVSVEDIEAAAYLLRRLKKDARPEAIADELLSYGRDVRRMVRQALDLR
jgi:hypothetical protein